MSRAKTTKELEPKNPPGILLYQEMEEELRSFTDAQFGQLVRGLLAYNRDKVPEFEEPMLALAFGIYKKNVDWNREKYDNIRRRNYENALKRWKNREGNLSDVSIRPQNQADPGLIPPPEYEPCESYDPYLPLPNDWR